MLKLQDAAGCFLLVNDRDLIGAQRDRTCLTTTVILDGMTVIVDGLDAFDMVKKHVGVAGVISIQNIVVRAEYVKWASLNTTGLAIRIYFDKKNHVIVKFESRDEALVTMNMIEKNVEAATMPSIESKLMDIDCELAVLRDHLVPSGWD